MRTFLILSLLFFLFTAEKCEQVNTEQYQYPAESSISMEKTGCYGSCPIYTITIHADGRAEYNGRRFVKKEGAYRKTFSPKQTNALFQAFDSAGLHSYQDEYTAPVTDLPYTYLSWVHEGRTKKITLYYDFPEKLDGLAKLVASFAESEGWEKSVE